MITTNQSNELLRRYYTDRQNRKHLDRPERRGLSNFVLTKPDLRTIFEVMWTKCENLTLSQREALLLATAEEDVPLVGKRVHKLIDDQREPAKPHAFTDAVVVEIRKALPPVCAALSRATFGKDEPGRAAFPIDRATEERRLFAIVWDLYREGV